MMMVVIINIVIMKTLAMVIATTITIAINMIAQRARPDGVQQRRRAGRMRVRA